MPGPRSSSRSLRAASSDPAQLRRRAIGRMLVVIDNEPLQREAWAEFHSARKRLDKVSGELHRHEEVDIPAFNAWLSQVFPELLTEVRTLAEEVHRKEAQTDRVQAMHFVTGRSMAKLWAELKAYEADPAAFEAEAAAEEAEEDDDEFEEADLWDAPEKEAGGGKKRIDESEASDRFFASEGRFGAAHPPIFERAITGKEIYRRLVQRLHPDRGGEWTPARERLWHEVQQAWATRDIDWLTRLEVEWEQANDILGPTSPVGRLRAAIEQLHHARRDSERKLREYRPSLPWRFTLSEKKRGTLRDYVKESFQHDLDVFRRHLSHLNNLIKSWERVPRGHKKVPKKNARQPAGRGRAGEDQ